MLSARGQFGGQLGHMISTCYLWSFPYFNLHTASSMRPEVQEADDMTMAATDDQQQSKKLKVEVSILLY